MQQPSSCWPMLAAENETMELEKASCYFTDEDSEGVNGIASDFIDFETE